MRVRSTAMTCQQPHRPISSGVTATRLIRHRLSRPCCFSHFAVASGGKSLLGEQAFGFFQDSGLVAFESEEVITS